MICRTNKVIWLISLLDDVNKDQLDATKYLFILTTADFSQCSSIYLYCTKLEYGFNVWIRYLHSFLNIKLWDDGNRSRTVYCNQHASDIVKISEYLWAVYHSFTRRFFFIIIYLSIIIYFTSDLHVCTTKTGIRVLQNVDCIIHNNMHIQKKPGLNVNYRHHSSILILSWFWKCSVNYDDRVFFFVIMLWATISLNEVLKLKDTPPF